MSGTILPRRTWIKLHVRSSCIRCDRTSIPPRDQHEATSTMIVTLQSLLLDDGDTCISDKNVTLLLTKLPICPGSSRLYGNHRAGVEEPLGYKPELSRGLWRGECGVRSVRSSAVRRAEGSMPTRKSVVWTLSCSREWFLQAPSVSDRTPTRSRGEYARCGAVLRTWNIHIFHGEPEVLQPLNRS
jgi:hypothetical protein